MFARADRVVLPSVALEDCFGTGRHVIVLPTYYGSTSATSVQGCCRQCGIVKRYPAHYRALSTAAKDRPRYVPPAFEPSRIEPVTERAIPPDVALDALCHDRVGNARALEQLALQIEPSQLFVDRFLRGLESLGHIEVRRDAHTLVPTSWEVAPTALVQIKPDVFVLVGFRSQRILTTLESAANAIGATVERRSQENAPARVRVRDCDQSAAESLARRIFDETGATATIATTAAASMARLLPPLGAIREALPRTAMVGYRSVNRWNEELARWIAVGDASAPGAYQLLGTMTIYCLRDAEDVQNGTMRRGDARLVKHLASSGAGFPLLGYDEDDKTLYAPLGAELPGLYSPRRCPRVRPAPVRRPRAAPRRLPVRAGRHRRSADRARCAPEEATRVPRTPLTVYMEIRDAYLRYVDTAYWLRDSALMEERRHLLEDGEAIFADVLLEPVLPYDPVVELGPLAASIGLRAEAAELVGEALLGAFAESDGTIRLRRHQAEALKHSFQPNAEGRNVVVTSGTGSGKTESFLLPVLARIVDEALSYGVDPEPLAWWQTVLGSWQSVRQFPVRPPATRALVLYPTNALVEDQITRLRRATRVLAARDPRARLWFGRYTGSTLGNGTPPQPGGSGPIVREVAEELRDLVIEFDRLRAAAVDPSLLDQFSDPREGEMLTRWDMIAAPPDILVTNFSMLNAMLMRDVEEPLFDTTRRWIESGGVFTLVVDELHLYRGTSGSEVAMIVRNLLSRLGVAPDSSNLRCIATSASLGDDESGLDYLEAFFGVDRRSFFVTSGEPRHLTATLPVSRAEVLTAAEAGPSRDTALVQMARELHLPAALAEACRAERDRPRATRLTTIADRLFDEADADRNGIAAALEAIELLGPGPESISFRSHMFARTMRGVWACTNPECTEVDGADDLPGIGRLFGIPTSTCGCGARVLELLYCFECGDISFGGFVAGIEGTSRLLTSSPVEVPASSAGLVFRRPYSSYVWYRPGTLPPGRRWSHANAPGGGSVELTFGAAHWDPFLGAVTPGRTPSTGVVMNVRGLPVDESWSVPALPERCPHCDLRTGTQDLGQFYRGIVRSPIRAHTAGLAQATQLLLSQLHRSMGATAEESRTIVFTDSRDDVARAAVGVERNHFRDLVRQLVRKQLEDPGLDRTEVARRGAADESSLSDEERAAFDELSIHDPSLVRAYMRASMDHATLDDATRIAQFEASEVRTRGRRPWPVILQRTMADLVDLGVNPAGPKASMGHLVADGRLPWYQAQRPPIAGLWEPLAPEVVTHDLARQRESLATELASSIFDRVGRDVESIGLGWIDADVALNGWPIPTEVASGVFRAVIRILGTARRYAGGNPSLGDARGGEAIPEGCCGALRRRCRGSVRRSGGVAQPTKGRAGMGARDGGRRLKTRARCSDERRPVELSALLASSSPPCGWRLHRDGLQPSAQRRSDPRSRGTGLLRLARVASPPPTACSRADGPDETTLAPARATTALPRSVASAARRERPNEPGRCLIRNDDDGGRRRHRLAPLRDDGECPSPAL